MQPFRDLFYIKNFDLENISCYGAYVLDQKNKKIKTYTNSNCWQLELRKTYLLAGFSYSSRIPHEAMPESSMRVNEPNFCLAYGQQPFRNTSSSR